MAIFARAPLPGRAKTRLIPQLGARGAAELQAALTTDTIRKVDALTGRVARWLFLAGSRVPKFPASERWDLERQRGAGLGERLDAAFRKLFRDHPAAVVIGTDSPLLPPRVLRGALNELRSCDAVLGPCPDGGFYLIGLRRLVPGLFRGVRWGTASAFRDMLRNLLRSDLACSVLEPIADVDRPGDCLSLVDKLGRSRAMRRLAPACWKFLKRLRTRREMW